MRNSQGKECIPCFGADILVTEHKCVSKHSQLSLSQTRGRMNFQPLLQAPGFGGSIPSVKPLWDLSVAVKMSLQCHRSSEGAKNRSFVSWYSLMYCAMSVLLVCPFQRTLNLFIRLKSSKETEVGVRFRLSQQSQLSVFNVAVSGAAPGGGGLRSSEGRVRQRIRSFSQGSRAQNEPSPHTSIGTLAGCLCKAWFDLRPEGGAAPPP